MKIEDYGRVSSESLIEFLGFFSAFVSVGSSNYGLASVLFKKRDLYETAVPGVDYIDIFRGTFNEKVDNWCDAFCSCTESDYFPYYFVYSADKSNRMANKTGRLLNSESINFIRNYFKCIRSNELVSRDYLSDTDVYDYVLRRIYWKEEEERIDGEEHNDGLSRPLNSANRLTE